MTDIFANGSYSRRSFVKKMSCITIGITMGQSCSRNAGQKGQPHYHVVTNGELPRSLQRNPALDAWIKILEDNRIRVFTGKIELGQGITTAIKQIAAEELNCDLNLVEVVMADTVKTPNEGYTAGSGSVKGSAMAVKYAAAAGRQHLCAIAADHFGTTNDKVILRDGILKTTDGQNSIAIKSLLENHKWNIEPTLPISFKKREDWEFIGKSIRRRDLEKIVRGRSYFIQDLNIPGMVHARIIRTPNLTDLSENDWRNIMNMVPPHIKFIRDGRFAAAVSPDEYEVVKISTKIENDLMDKVGRPDLRSSVIKRKMEDWVYKKEQIMDDQLVRPQEGTMTFSGSFFKPYVMHGSIGPACGIAHYSGGKMKIWSHSQGVYPLQAAIASLLDLDEEAIEITGVPGPGCFGHNSSDDAAADAAVIARAVPDVPVRVLWSRTQEHSFEALGSAMQMDIEAELDFSGTITYWNTDVWSDSHSTRPNKDPGTLLTSRYLKEEKVMKGNGYVGGGHRNADPYYMISSKKITAHFFRGPLRVSSLRSLGAYANIFAIESMIDEMRLKTKMHPIDFRIKNLDDDRAIEVLKKIKQMTSGVDIMDQEGIGYSFSRYKNNDAYCAVAARVKIITKKVELIKIWSVVDAGEVINPDGLINQTEGAIIQAASWTLLEEVTYDNMGVRSSDWAQYPILRFDNIPEVEVELIIPKNVPPLGGGEAATAPTPAAITNAIYDAQGVRIYDLPVRL